MGSRGNKATTQGAFAARSTLAALEPLGAVSARSMFGGHGLFYEDTMFGIVDSAGDLFLRADATTAPVYQSAGSAKHSRMPYWEVPANVRDDPEVLREWAGRAVSVALAAKR